MKNHLECYISLFKEKNMNHKTWMIGTLCIGCIAIASASSQVTNKLPAKPINASHKPVATNKVKPTQKASKHPSVESSDHHVQHTAFNMGDNKDQDSQVNHLPEPPKSFLKPGVYLPKEALKTFLPILDLKTSLKHVTMAGFPPHDLLPMLQHLMRVSYTVKQSLYEARSAQNEIQVSRAEWLPQLTTDMDLGRQRRKNPGTTDDTLFTFNQQDVSLSQLIYDFGKTGADIDSANVRFLLAKNDFKAAIENELVAGISSYCGLIRDAKTTVFSIQSAARISDQYKVEKIRYDKGAGLKTDLLEVAAQLSGAKARVITTKASLAKSENNYLAVFHEVPGDFEFAKYPRVPRNLIPKTMAQALSVAHHENTEIKDAEYRLQLAIYEIKSARSAFFPTLSGNLDYSRQHNVSGTKDTRRVYTGQFDLSYNLFDSGGDIAQLLADHNSRYAAEDQLRESYLTVDESIRNDWEDYVSANLSYVYLVKQVKQLKQFLKLAKKERLLGQRSILDVLLADINVIDAESEATTAHATAVISAYTLLKDMGTLDMSKVVEGRPGSAR
jgi:TolC family type I secretion outer membrane protein